MQRYKFNIIRNDASQIKCILRPIEFANLSHFIRNKDKYVMLHTCYNGNKLIFQPRFYSKLIIFHYICTIKFHKKVWKQSSTSSRF